MEQFFTIDIRKLTTAECRAMSRGFELFVLLVARALRLNPAGHAMLRYDPDSKASVTEMDKLPASLREPAQESIVSLMAHRFLPVLVLRDPHRRCAIDAVDILLVEPEVEVVCKVRVARSAATWPPRFSESIHFMTLCEDGTLLVTGDDPGELSLRAQAEFEVLRDAEPGELLNRHLDRVETVRSRSPIVPVNAYDVEEFHREVECRAFTYWTKRGVFVPASPEQVAMADGNWDGVDPAAEYADVMVEIRRQQTERPGGIGAALTLFIVSLAAFAVAGSALWELDTLALLVGILLFHEAGHFVAMKVFGYRNVKMFFLPMFGAAVSGDAQRAVSWKRALVALAGPVPGILVGAGVGLWAAWAGQTDWQKPALLMLVLNAANLLPLLPLDGGHVLHAVIFQRSRWADLIFRILAGVGMILLGGVMRVLGILLLLQCRTTYRVGRAVERLRVAGRGRDPEGVPVMSPGATGEIAEELAGELASAQRMRMKDFAHFVKDAYSRLNVAPPGLLASLGILALYAGSLLVAAVVGLSLFWIYAAGHAE